MKNLKLTPGQLHVLEALNSSDKDEVTTGVLCNNGPFKNVRGRLNSLKRRGFLLDRWAGKYHFWRAGPMMDALKETGILP